MIHVHYLLLEFQAEFTEIIPAYITLVNYIGTKYI